MSGSVTKEYWSFWLGDMPMPDGATIDMLWAAHDALQLVAEEESDVALLKMYYDSRVKYMDRLEVAESYGERTKLSGMITTIDDGIRMLAERLNQ